MVSSDLATLLRAYEPDTTISTEDTEMSLPVYLHHISMFEPRESGSRFMLLNAK